MKQREGNVMLSTILWLLGSFFVPVTVPWLIYKLVEHHRARNNIHGKVVMITGASSGLGEALAHAFYRVGCRVIIASRNIEELQRVKADLLAIHTVVETFNPEVFQLDLADLPLIPTCVNDVLKFHGRIDILVNNGGISYRGSIQKSSIEVDQKVMMVNYFGQVCLTKAVLPIMIKNGCGHIVAVSSVQGRISIPHRSAYAASKHALQAFCDCLRAEVAKFGIKVTVASPGYINTKLSLNAITGTGERYGILDGTTASGYTPEEAAESIMSAVLRGKKEILLAPLSPKLAILLRVIFPSLYFYIMEKRALKSIED